MPGTRSPGHSSSSLFRKGQSASVFSKTLFSFLFSDQRSMIGLTFQCSSAHSEHIHLLVVEPCLCQSLTCYLGMWKLGKALKQLQIETSVHHGYLSIDRPVYPWLAGWLADWLAAGWLSAGCCLAGSPAGFSKFFKVCVKFHQQVNIFSKICLIQ